eukprot:TRINITY_DN85568_c0_g1_i1.p1 TRINITY_DN85568_c0_g1~~TRINITY_DN85568_c0_g1_i1.p1  ORF type:complete len:334 (-),score=149.19 TRINITY_DN85568_c0_g1_i1:26-1027(-)
MSAASSNSNNSKTLARIKEAILLADQADCARVLGLLDKLKNTKTGKIVTDFLDDETKTVIIQAMLKMGVTQESIDTFVKAGPQACGTFVQACVCFMSAADMLTTIDMLLRRHKLNKHLRDAAKALRAALVDLHREQQDVQNSIRELAGQMSPEQRRESWLDLQDSFRGYAERCQSLRTQVDAITQRVNAEREKNEELKKEEDDMAQQSAWRLVMELSAVALEATLTGKVNVSSGTAAKIGFHTVSTGVHYGASMVLESQSQLFAKFHSILLALSGALGEWKDTADEGAACNAQSVQHLQNVLVPRLTSESEVNRDLIYRLTNEFIGDKDTFQM